MTGYQKTAGLGQRLFCGRISADQGPLGDWHVSDSCIKIAAVPRRHAFNLRRIAQPIDA
jgi:hypothetical protein